MSIQKIVEDNIPSLVFSKNERYLPCDLFFAGCEIEKNRRAYDNLGEGQKEEKACCYYRFNEGKKFKVCQYWYYYAYNLYPPFDNHIHDIECVKLFINKKTEEPEYITCNLHKGRQIARLENGKVPALEVELGGHGMLAKVPGLKLPLYWRGKEGKSLSIPPRKDLEDLRTDVLKEPEQVMTKDFKLVGKDFGGVGKHYAPLLPWVRWEYYLPEETLLEAAGQELYYASASIDQGVTKLSENLPLTKIGAEEGALLKAQLKISINEVSSLEAALKKTSVPLEAVIPIYEYTEILKNIGIATADDLTKAKPETVHLQMKDYVKKQKLDVEILSTKDIARVRNEVNQMLTKSAK